MSIFEIGNSLKPQTVFVDMNLNYDCVSVDTDHNNLLARETVIGRNIKNCSAPWTCILYFHDSGT